jgi:hypothetical protein
MNDLLQDADTERLALNMNAPARPVPLCALAR